MHNCRQCHQPAICTVVSSILIQLCQFCMYEVCLLCAFWKCSPVHDKQNDMFEVFWNWARAIASSLQVLKCLLFLVYVPPFLWKGWTDECEMCLQRNFCILYTNSEFNYFIKSMALFCLILFSCKKKNPKFSKLECLTCRHQNHSWMHQKAYIFVSKMYSLMILWIANYDAWFLDSVVNQST